MSFQQQTQQQHSIGVQVVDNPQFANIKDEAANTAQDFSNGLWSKVVGDLNTANYYHPGKNFQTFMAFVNEDLLAKNHGFPTPVLDGPNHVKTPGDLLLAGVDNYHNGGELIVRGPLPESPLSLIDKQGYIHNYYEPEKK